MRRMLAQQLPTELKRFWYSYYFLCGADLFLHQESLRTIVKTAKTHGFNEVHSMPLNSINDWPSIENICLNKSLFSSHQVLQLSIENTPVSSILAQKLTQLFSLLEEHWLLILSLPTFKKKDEAVGWFQLFKKRALYIDCRTPKPHQLPNWVIYRAETLGLHLEQAVVETLCFYYENNLSSLAQLLDRLSLLYPNSKLTLPRIQHIVHNAAQFTPQQWLIAILQGQAQRAMHILQKLKVLDTEPLILIRILQKDLLLLFDLKRQHTHIPLSQLFDRYLVWQFYRKLLQEAMQRLSHEQLKQAIQQLAYLECFTKKVGGDIWNDITYLTLLLCGLDIYQPMLKTISLLDEFNS